MNMIKCLNERQYGKISEPWKNYDSVLHRLIVEEKDSCSGILSSREGADFNPEPPIFAAKFAIAKDFEHILAIANEDGMVAFHDTARVPKTEANVKPLMGHQMHHNAVFDLAWMPFHTQIVSASGDHTARLWDLQNCQPTPTRIFSGHTRSLKTACFRPDDPAVFATGGRDGAIFIWDVRSISGAGSLYIRADDSISGCHGSTSGTPGQIRRRSRNVQTPLSGGLSSLSRPQSITGLVFRDSYDLISCGAGDGIIKIWDLRKTYANAKREAVPRQSLSYAGSSACKGFTNLILDPMRIKLYANCMDNRIYCYNASGAQDKPIYVYSGLENATFYIKSALSPDGRYLISGSSDERAYIWNIDWPTPLVALEGHADEVTCVAWCPIGEPKLVTCSDDAKHKIWRIGHEDLDETMLKGRTKPIAGYQNGFRTNTHSLEYTPRSAKRWVGRSEKTPSTGSNLKIRILCDRCETLTPVRNVNTTGPADCVKCQMLHNQTSSRCLKRNSSDMLGSHDSSDPNLQYKRIHTENKGARRLFEQQTSNSSELLDLHVIPEEVDKLTEPCSSRTLSEPMTPVSNRVKNAIPTTTPQSSRILTFSSPTMNLPNYVVSGEAPHLRTISPKKKCKENVNWLTRHRRQKRLYDDFTSNSDDQEQSSPKMRDANRTHDTPAKRQNRSRSSTENVLKTPKQNNVRNITLLKFFTVIRDKQSLINNSNT